MDRTLKVYVDGGVAIHVHDVGLLFSVRQKASIAMLSLAVKISGTITAADVEGIENEVIFGSVES